MNELQIGILVFVVVLVLGVLAYNKWEEEKHRKAAERMFQSSTAADKDDADVLFRRPARAAPPQDNAKAAQVERLEPGLSAETANNAPTAEAAATPKTAIRQYLWEGIDAIAMLDLVEAASAEQILTSWQEAPPRLQKLLRWVGLDENRGEWEVLSPKREGFYRRLRAGLQLTDRQGPIGVGEFSRFIEIVRRVAKEHTAQANLPDRGQALDQAQQLEQFCYDVDIQISVNLASRSAPFPGTKIRALAESAGMTLGKDGAYIRQDDDGATLFYLQNAGGEQFTAETLKTMYVGSLVFLLDVPVTPRGSFIYKQMVDIARRFADTLGGVLVDDRGQPLSDAQLAQICQNYVAKPQARMDAAGLTAGGALATRLFS
jgi:FtsZ-interacting cell division protein ZipA